jgi:hypothetical protein
MRGETSSTPAADGVGDSDNGLPSGRDEGDSDSDAAEPLLDHVNDGVAPARGHEHEVVSGETRCAPVDDGFGEGDSGMLSCSAEGVSNCDAAEPLLDTAATSSRTQSTASTRAYAARRAARPTTTASARAIAACRAVATRATVTATLPSPRSTSTTASRPRADTSTRS